MASAKFGRIFTFLVAATATVASAETTTQRRSVRTHTKVDGAAGEAAAVEVGASGMVRRAPPLPSEPEAEDSQEARRNEAEPQKAEAPKEEPKADAPKEDPPIFHPDNGKAAHEDHDENVTHHSDNDPVHHDDHGYADHHDETHHHDHFVDDYGCFARQGNDAPGPVEYMDTTCVEFNGSDSAQPCRSGLPFYRRALLKEETSIDCLSFCVSKGLDLAGVLRTGSKVDEEAMECRCGATAQNLMVWHNLNGTVPKHLLLMASSALNASDPECPISVFRFSGPLETLEMAAFDLSQNDMAYLDSVVSGERHWPEGEPEPEEPEDVDDDNFYNFWHNETDGTNAQVKPHEEDAVAPELPPPLSSESLAAAEAQDEDKEAEVTKVDAAAKAALGDKKHIKYIAGVPFHNYHMAHPGGMAPSVLELAEQRQWVVVLPENFTVEQTRPFCEELPGNARCTLRNNPSPGGICFVAITATEPELKQHLETNRGAVFGEPDLVLPLIPEIPPPHAQAHTHTHAPAGVRATHGLDRIDSRQGLDGDYGVPNGGAGVTVYVVDSGIRVTHADFEGRAKRGIDLCVRKDCEFMLGKYSGWPDGRGDPSCGMDPVNGHGTHCAGTVASKTWGVAKAAKVVSMKVFCDDGTGGMTGIIAQAMSTVGLIGGKAVISLSLGSAGRYGQVMDYTVQRLMRSKNIAVVASSGNENVDSCGHSPSNHPSIIAVGAMHPKLDTRSSYSNWGKCVDIHAPGDVIDSTTHTADHGSRLASGTSMAGPHVAGAMAVLMGNGLDAAGAKAKLLADATLNAIKDVKGAPNRLLYVAPVGPPRRRRAPSPSPGGGGGRGFPPCFEREASFAYAAASVRGPWMVTRMVKLKAGDYVLASDKNTGAPFADRVLTNLHVRDTSRYPLLEIRHTLGSVTVTPDHVMFVDGDFRAARFVRPRSSMLITRLRSAELAQSGFPSQWSGPPAAANVTVLTVTPSSGRIVNPLTHSGLILVATGSGEALVGMLATTVLESPGNAMLAMAQYPGMGKMASYLFPGALQESALLENAILLMGQAGTMLPAWLGFLAFLLFDALFGLGFVAWNSGWALAVCAAFLGVRARRRQRKER